jgi:ribonuclease Z
MDLLFLGTSSGVPTKTRNVTALAIVEESGGGWYLVDCGEGTQQQLAHTALSLAQLHAIAISHVHGDHCYGLPGLLASAGMQGRKSPLTIIAPQGIEAWWRATQVHTQLYIPFELEFIEVETLAHWHNHNFRLSSIFLSHRVPSYAYKFEEINCPPSLDIEKLYAQAIPAGPLWGKLKKGEDVEYNGTILHAADYRLQQQVPRVIIIGGDNDSPELLTEACQNCQVLVHEATYTQEVAAKVGAGKGHSYALQVALFAESIHLPNLVLTHFSARYQPDTERAPSILDIENEARDGYNGNLFIAADFARYRLEKNGVFHQVKSARPEV